MDTSSLKIIIPFSSLIVIGIVIVAFASMPFQNNQQVIENSIELPQKYESITIGTVGSDAAKLTKRFSPTANYLAQKLSNDDLVFKGNVVITSNLEEMQELLLNQEVDLYFESPLSAFSTSQISDSEIFLLRWKENIPSYHSVFYVQKDSSISSIDDLSDKTIVFQGAESTSGYLLPLYHLKTNGFSIDGTSSKNLEFVFSDDDENSIIWVLENKVDVGVSSNQDISELPEEFKSKLKIIESTTELPRQLVSHRSEMSQERVENIKNILLDMHNNSEGKIILEKFKKTLQYTEIENKQELFDKLGNILSVLEMN